jgi:hypothetical protein
MTWIPLLIRFGGKTGWIVLFASVQLPNVRSFRFFFVTFCFFRFKDFPTVADMNKKYIKQYEEDSAMLQKPKDNGTTSLLDDASTQHLSNALSVSFFGFFFPLSVHQMSIYICVLIQMVPELQERKRLIDMHFNILSAMLEQMKARRLNEFFELEDIISQLRPLSNQASAHENFLVAFICHYSHNTIRC